MEKTFQHDFKNQFLGIENSYFSYTKLSIIWTRREAIIEIPNSHTHSHAHV